MSSFLHGLNEDRSDSLNLKTPDRLKYKQLLKRFSSITVDFFEFYRTLSAMKVVASALHV
jgi:hypothetical protein